MSAMYPDGTDELALRVRGQVAHLKTLLSADHRDDFDFHLAIAGILRSMLCDAEYPTLIEFARRLSIILKVWGPFPPDKINSRPPDFLLIALAASWAPANNGFEMSVIEYLDAPIGAVTVEFDSGPRGEWYTPKKLIKWVANKDGAAHFDPNKPATMLAVRNAVEVRGNLSIISPDGEIKLQNNDDFLIKAKILQIAHWAVLAGENLLSRYSGSPQS